MDIGNWLMSRRSATNDVDAEVLREGTVEGRDRVGERDNIGTCGCPR